MNQEDLTKTFLMHSNEKNPLVAMVYIKKISALMVKLKYVDITFIFYSHRTALASVHCLLHIILITPTCNCVSLSRPPT